MASKTPQELLAQQVASLSKHQSLNPVESSEFNQTFDSDSSFIGAARRAIIDNAKDDVFDYMGDIKAVVLHAWREDSTLLGYDKKVVVHVKARVPGLDFVPLPVGLPLNNDREDKLADWPAINRHDTFVAKEEYLPLPSPGDIIEVSFGNPNQRRDPVYLGILSKNKTPGSFGSPPSQNFHSGECKEERNESFDQETKPTETPEVEVPETKPSKIEPIPPDKTPKVGLYVGSTAHRIYKESSSKHSGVFKRRKDYSWVLDVAKAGIDYLDYKVKGGTRTQIHYTKKMSGGREVPEEAVYVRDHARANGFPNFEVHFWNAPRYFKGDSPHSVKNSEFQKTILPRVIKDAEEMAEFINRAQGKILDFHWNVERHAYVSTGSNRKTLNTIIATTWAQTFRSACKYPVRLWWNGFSPFIQSYDTEKVFAAFDIIQGQLWPGKHRLMDFLRAQGSKLPSPSEKNFSVTYSAGNYGNLAARKKKISDIDSALIENRASIWGAELFTLSSFLYKGYYNIPSIPQRVKAFKDQTGWDE